VRSASRQSARAMAVVCGLPSASSMGLLTLVDVGIFVVRIRDGCGRGCGGDDRIRTGE
jgi:hypothetical protein